MSTMATSTVSMVPAATAAFSSSSPRLPAIWEPHHTFDVNRLSCILDDPRGDVEGLQPLLREALDKPKWYRRARILTLSR